jgi:hypothetical protein
MAEQKISPDPVVDIDDQPESDDKPKGKCQQIPLWAKLLLAALGIGGIVAIVILATGACKGADGPEGTGKDDPAGKKAGGDGGDGKFQFAESWTAVAIDDPG